MAIVMVTVLNRATAKSKQALDIAQVIGAYGLAYDALHQQQLARSAGDVRAHAAATASLRATLAAVGALDVAERPRAGRLLGRLWRSRKASSTDTRPLASGRTGSASARRRASAGSWTSGGSKGCWRRWPSAGCGGCRANAGAGSMKLAGTRSRG